MSDEYHCSIDDCDRVFDTKGGCSLHETKTHDNWSIVETQCKHCNVLFEKDEYKYKRDNEHFCTQDCHTDYHSPKVVCDFCSDVFRKKKALVDENDWNFCDLDCRNSWYRCNGEHLGPESTLEVIVCDFCGESFEKSPQRIERSEKDYCSTDCHYEDRKGRFQGEDNPNFTSEEVECSWCGETKYEIASRIERSENFFCDKRCHGEWKSENVVGEDHPRWEGGSGPSYYGPNWVKRRSRCLERDGWECLRCGLTNGEHLLMEERNLDVHHIVPLKTFGNDYESANDLENLASLCRSCHGDMESLSESEQRKILFGDDE